MSFFKRKFTKASKNSVIEKIPPHIAIIMDGNARWASKKGLPTSFGHKKGAENIQKIAESCIEIGVKYLTLYAFSAENWNRPKEEVDYLMNLLNEYLQRDINPLIEKDVKISIFGDLEKLSSVTKSRIEKIENSTKNNKSLNLNIAFSYGARQEITSAVKKIALEVMNHKIMVDDISEEVLSNNLYSKEIPDPDLLIRTGGDFRVSNFLLWQIAYSELYFTETFWPDFSRKNLIHAIENFNKRERKYGKR